MTKWQEFKRLVLFIIVFGLSVLLSVWGGSLRYVYGDCSKDPEGGWCTEPGKECGCCCAPGGGPKVCYNRLGDCECGCPGGGPPCTCTPCTCQVPSQPVWRTPTTVDVRPGTVLQWNAVGDWGKDGGSTGNCPCSGCTLSLTRNYKLYVGDDNVTAHCAGDKPASDGSRMLTQPYCKLDSVDPNWNGNNIDFAVVASNAGCYSYAVRRFHVDAPPSIVSVSPSSGLSGTETNSDNGLSCSDNNPQEFTVAYSDPDGASDLGRLALWIGKDGVETDDPRTDFVGYRSRNLHALIGKGSEIKVWARNVANGLCAGDPSIMEILVNDRVEQTYLIGDYRSVVYHHPTVVSASQVKVRFANDCYDTSTSPVSNRDLWVDKMSLNGKVYEMESAVCRNSRSDAEQYTRTVSINGKSVTELLNGWIESYVSCSDTTKYGSNSYSIQGMSCDTNGAEICGEVDKTGCACWKNHNWDVPIGGLTIPVGGNQTVCSTNSGNDVVSTNNCAGHPVGWNVTRVTTSGNTATVTYKVWFQQNIGQDLKLQAFAQDHSGRSAPWTDSPTHAASPLWRWTLDTYLPTTIINNVTVQDKQTVRVSWTVRDSTSGLTRSYGVPGLFDSDYATGSKRVQNKSTGAQIALPTSGDGFVPVTASSTKLWSDNYSGYPTTVRNGTETIDIMNVENGVLRFRQYAEDRACNSNSGDSTNDVNIAYPWLITKGGLVFGGGGVMIDINNSDSAGLFDALPGLFAVRRNQVQISTEWIGIGVGSPLESVVENSASPYRTLSYADENAGLTFSGLKQLLDDRVGSGEVVVGEASVGTPLSGNVSSMCSDDLCVLTHVGNLTVNNLNCDKGTVVLVSGGSITIDGVIAVVDTPGEEGRNGCIFLVENNINVEEGAWVSSGHATPQYDLLQGFFIAGGGITLPEVDSSRGVADGLKVDGSLIALGGGQSIDFQRSLKLLDNMTEPTVVIHHDARYLFLASQFFAESGDEYRKDVGFKPY